MALAAKRRQPVGARRPRSSRSSACGPSTFFSKCSGHQPPGERPAQGESIGPTSVVNSPSSQEFDLTHCKEEVFEIETMHRWAFSKNGAILPQSARQTRPFVAFFLRKFELAWVVAFSTLSARRYFWHFGQHAQQRAMGKVRQLRPQCGGEPCSDAAADILCSSVWNTVSS